MTDQFKLRIEVRILASAGLSSNDRTVEKIVYLRFPPFLGLVVCGTPDWGAKIDELRYDVDEDEFRAELSDKAFYRLKGPPATKEELEERVKEYESGGWERK